MPGPAPQAHLRRALLTVLCPIRCTQHAPGLLQNNLLEMWALFNFCAPDVLGDAADFKCAALPCCQGGCLLSSRNACLCCIADPLLQGLVH